MSVKLGEVHYDLIFTEKQKVAEGKMDEGVGCTMPAFVTTTTVKTIRFKDGGYDIYGK